MKLLRHLYMQVLVAVILGCAVGAIFPGFGAALKPINDGFIGLVTMLISPIIFGTIVVGMGGMRDLKKVGRVGIKALVYFELVTTIALVIGLIVVNVLKPGAGVHARAESLNEAAVAAVTGPAKMPVFAAYVLDIIPVTFVGALTSGKILQVLFAAVLFGAGLARLGKRVEPVTEFVGLVLKVLMEILTIIMRVAPLAAFGAMAYMVAKFGFGSLRAVAYLMGCVYLTMAIFVLVFLGAVLRFNGLSIWRFLRYLREELLLVLGTSSSETALPGLMLKMEQLGCTKSVVGLVVPAGYSFNLDGTSIYLTMGALFIAQATDTPLGLLPQLGLLGVMLLTSKGAAGVTGSGFVTLSASLASSPVPISGLTLILGIDRFMSQARSLTNLIGNGVAVVTIAAWEGELDRVRARRVLAGQPFEMESAATQAAIENQI